MPSAHGIVIRAHIPIANRLQLIRTSTRLASVFLPSAARATLSTTSPHRVYPPASRIGRVVWGRPPNNKSPPRRRGAPRGNEHINLRAAPVDLLPWSCKRGHVIRIASGRFGSQWDAGTLIVRHTLSGYGVRQPELASEVRLRHAAAPLRDVEDTRRRLCQRSNATGARIRSDVHHGRQGSCAAACPGAIPAASLM